jgi:RNA polymerase sigma-70 factor (ECF subfamily)
MTKPAAASQVSREKVPSSSENDRKRRLAALFEAHYDYVYQSLRRLGVYPSDVEDVAHDMFLTVYAKLDQLDETRPPRPWLFAFAARFASDYRRLARHRATEDVSTLGAADQESPEDAAGRREQQSLAMRALDTLSMETRSVFVGYELEELPMKELADALDIPLNTAYSRLRLAREQLSKVAR